MIFSLAGYLRGMRKRVRFPPPPPENQELSAHQGRKWGEIALLCPALAGCVTIDAQRPPPPDFPRLRVEIVQDQIAEHCAALDVACARLYFDQGVCLIHVPRWAPAWWIEHERQHCDGRDHLGKSDIRDGWQRWKDQTRRAWR